MLIQVPLNWTTMYNASVNALSLSADLKYRDVFFPGFADRPVAGVSFLYKADHLLCYTQVLLFPHNLLKLTVRIVQLFGMILERNRYSLVHRRHLQQPNSSMRTGECIS